MRVKTERYLAVGGVDLERGCDHYQRALLGQIMRIADRRRGAAARR